MRDTKTKEKMEKSFFRKRFFQKNHAIKVMAFALALIILFSAVAPVVGSRGGAAYGAGLSDIDAFLSELSLSARDSVDPWDVMSLAAYENCTGNLIITQEARQRYINTAISVISKGATLGELAKHIIALRSVGVDPARLYAANSVTPINAYENMCSALEKAAWDYEVYTLPFVLTAFELSGAAIYAGQRDAIVSFLVSSRCPEGGWGVDWGYGLEPDADATMMVLCGLAPYYLNGLPDVINAVEIALRWLAGQQGAQGAFGMSYGGVTYYSAYSSGLASIALCSLGLDPETNSYLSYSALNGLRSFMGDDGFIGGDYQAQGFRGLLAAKVFSETGGSYDVYDFSRASAQPGIATGEGAVNKPGDPTSVDEIVVYFTLNGVGGQTWISKRAVAMPSDATMYHLFTKVLDSAGYSYKDAEVGYIQSITTPWNAKLSDFDYGFSSGWIYSVNGEVPVIGILDKKLTDGDDVVWYYTSDYTKEPGMEIFADVPIPAARPDGERPKTTVEIKTSPVVVDGKAIAEIKSDAIRGALTDALDKREKAGGEGIAQLKVTVSFTGSETSSLTGSKVKLRIADIKALAAKKDVELTVDCGLAMFSFDSDTLKRIAGGVGDDEVFELGAELLPASKANTVAPGLAAGSSLYELGLTVGKKRFDKIPGSVKILLRYIPQAKVNPDSLTVYLISGDAKVLPVGNTQFAPGLGYEFETTLLSLYFIGDTEAILKEDEAILPWVSPFIDVKPDAWHIGAVEFVYEKGLMTGTGTNPPVFSPDLAITRAMLNAALQRLHGGNPYISNPFSDVEDDAWYAAAALWAYENNIDPGRAEGLYGPDDALCREEIALILMNCARFAAHERSDWRENEKNIDLSRYKDANDITLKHISAMIWAVGSGIIRGRSGVSLDPAGIATRAEAAVMLQRYIGIYERDRVKR